MNLLEENQTNKPKATKGEKTVKMLLVLSVILVIVIICLMVYLKSGGKNNNKITIKINGEEKVSTEGLIVNSTEGVRYISLRELSDLLGYKFDNSDYKEFITDKNKAYIKNGSLISGFETNSKKMYKYEEKTNIDYQYYELNYEILKYNEQIYIAIADLPLALNVQCQMDTNNIIINTTEYLKTNYQEKFKDYKITDNQNDLKALTYGWIIVSKDELWGVLDTNGNELINCRYSTMTFDESSLNFITSNSRGKYGIVSIDKTIQTFIYDKIEILNYEHELYKILNDNKYGIMRKDGSLLANIEYDKIGDEGAVYTLIIPEQKDSEIDVPESIVVQKDGKYGLIAINDGNNVLPCDHLNKIYSVENMGTIDYMVEVNNEKMALIDYLKWRANI